MTGLTDEQKAAYVATRLAKLKTGSYSFTKDGVTLTLSNWCAMRQPVEGEQPTISGFVRDDTNGTFLEVTVAAEDANGILPIQKANPFLFSLPPITAWDGTWRKEVAIKFPDGIEITADVKNEPENPLEAIKTTVFDVVTRAARNNGWGG